MIAKSVMASSVRSSAGNCTRCGSMPTARSRRGAVVTFRHCHDPHGGWVLLRERRDEFPRAGAMTDGPATFLSRDQDHPCSLDILTRLVAVRCNRLPASGLQPQ